MSDKLVIEIGAGDGSTAWTFSQLPGITVRTFEPSTAMRKIAFTRLGDLENVTLLPYAVGGDDRQATLNNCNGSEASLHYGSAPREGCTVVSMNHLFVTFRIAEIDTLLIDCNGSEYEILEQMIECDRLRQVRRLVITWNGSEPERQAEICDALTQTHELTNGAWALIER